jgi:predicted DNA-binding transcriptional regulator YafY
VFFLLCPRLTRQRENSTAQSFCVVELFFFFSEKYLEMPVNRNALLRYKTIDHCLRNRRRKWTLDDLIEAVSNTLYEYEGIDKGISRRSIQADLQVMRSSRLGYNAPIVVTDKKYYSYADKDYSITNIPLSEQDLARMNEAVEMLRQFKGFSHFSQLNEVVQKLEDHVYAATNNTRSVIEFEKNDQLKGLNFLDELYRSIIQQKTLRLSYQSFTARTAHAFFFHPWWLKEFKNRWFVVGVKGKSSPVMTLALDRIHSLEVVDMPLYIPNEKYDAGTYYKDVIGVSVSENVRPSNVKIQVDPTNAPYVETKPLHHSQQVVERNEKGIIISLKVQINFELQREILGFGPAMTVLAPESLRKELQKKFFEGVTKYENSTTEKEPGEKEALLK